MPHKLGQVFLHDHNIIRKIVDKSGVNATDTVVEIGCGDGILTHALAQLVQQLHVIEIDAACIESTQAHLSKQSNLCPVHYYHSDVLDKGLSDIPFDSLSVVANIPYYISAKIIKRLIADRQQLTTATLMVQKEFADKLLASPGDKLYSSLNIYASYYFKIEKCFLVSRSCFKPVPRVDSMVIRLTPHAHPPVEIDNEDAFFALVRSAFWGRRKPLASALAKSPYLSLKPGFKDIDFFKEHPGIRGELLSLEAFATLYQALRVYS